MHGSHVASPSTCVRATHACTDMACKLMCNMHCDGGSGSPAALHSHSMHADSADACKTNGLCLQQRSGNKILSGTATSC